MVFWFLLSILKRLNLCPRFPLKAIYFSSGINYKRQSYSRLKTPFLRDIFFFNFSRRVVWFFWHTCIVVVICKLICCRIQCQLHLSAEGTSARQSTNVCVYVLYLWSFLYMCPGLRYRTYILLRATVFIPLGFYKNGLGVPWTHPF